MASSSRSEIEMVPETSHVISVSSEIEMVPETSHVISVRSESEMVPETANVISVRSESEMVPETGKNMSVELFHGAIHGRLVLIPSPEEQRAGQQGTMLEGAPNWEIESMLQSVTSSRDTVLHLLVTNRHNNNLAMEVVQRDSSLLGAQNMMLETPLHCAAKVGNHEIIYRLIDNFESTVKEVLRKKNEKGDTALHVAAEHGHQDVACELMVCDREVAYIVNKKKLSPLNIAIVKENFEMVRIMIEIYPTLACTQFSNGLFPVHLAAHMGQTKMVKHFIEKYPDDAKLLDPRGRNLLHITAEEGRNDIFRDILEGPSVEEMLTTMNNAKDYEGNSLLHVAAMKGHSSLMKIIWEKNKGQDTINNQGLTPIDLFVRQLRATTKVDNSLASTVDHDRLSDKWFDNVRRLSLRNQWERTQVIGLGSVLIITVTFAAAFTIPGGYKQNNGTPVLGRRYLFQAFIVANTLAFIQGFLCLLQLFRRAAENQPGRALVFAIDLFMLAACSMVVAFGLGLYLTLASDCKPIAIFVLCCTGLIILSNMYVTSNKYWIGLASYVGTLLLIFGLPKLSDHFWSG